MSPRTRVAALIVVAIASSRCSGPSHPTGTSTNRLERIVVQPATAIAGSPDVTVTVRTSDISSVFPGLRIIVVWSESGTDTVLETAVVDSTTLNANVPPALLSRPRTATISVRKYFPPTDAGLPLSGGPAWISDPVTFSVTKPRPGQVASISPTSAQAGSPDLILTVTGSYFADDPHYRSLVVWTVGNSYWVLETSVIDANRLTAVLPAELLVEPITARVYVQTDDPESTFDSVGLIRPTQTIEFVVSAR
jgi:hypothetical protein